MSIKQRKGIWHCDFTTPDGKRIRRSLETVDKREAQELHDKLKADSWRSAKLGEAPVKLFDEACIRWLREKSHKRSLNADKSKITFFLDHFHGRELSTITNDQVQIAISKAHDRKHKERWEMMRERLRREGKAVPAYVARPISESSKYSLQAFMRSLLRIAATEWGWLNSVPVVKARQPRNKRIRWLTQDEARRIIDELPDYLKPVVIFALATGLRRANILDLEWSQVDMQRKMAWIHPEEAKSGKAIGVALNETACNVLRSQIGNHNRWVFVRQNNKEVRKLRVDSNKAWNAALKRAGIENFRFHDLRHTWASWLVQSGVPLSALQEMGGWESIEMVRRYAHLSPVHLTQHAKQIDCIFERNGTNMAHEERREIKNAM
ncbi:site-specific integrase [Brenneria sp. 4F2]|nr:site-specific integrase [Brenneria bubanii]